MTFGFGAGWNSYIRACSITVGAAY